MPQPKSASKWHKHQRGFNEVPVHSVGHQAGKERFTRRNGNRAPVFNQWRNNLTALSQRFNLYLVAYLDWIFVYQPNFPDQRLPKETLLQWNLPVSKPGLHGHMPGSPPHSVNNLLVAELGNAEVVVCACDDGDVLVYYTEPFLRGQKPTPLFHCNVGMSAWGLAVHREARLIAVSANSHEITVFAPALASNTCTETQDVVADGFPSYLPPKLVRRYSDWDLVRTLDGGAGKNTGNEIPATEPGPELVQYRRFNSKMHLKHHESNIPSISFCNTADDKTGKYLASSDITGTLVIWDLQSGGVVRIVRPSSDPQSRDADGRMDMIRSGWGVLFLDPKCFSRTKNIVEATGTCNKVSLWIDKNHVAPTVEIIDISESHSMVQNAVDRWRPGNNALEQELPYVPPAPTPTPNETDAVGPFVNENSDGEADYDHDDATSLQGENVNDEDDFLSLFPSWGRGGPFSRNHHESYRKNKQGRISEDKLWLKSDPETVKNSKWTMFCHSVYKIDAPDRELPLSPLLYLNPNKVHLFQSARMDWFNNENGPGPSPIVMLDDPLEQSAPEAIHGLLAQCDRLNLYVPIPDLGVVLIGSPKGRVAVLSLHLLEPGVLPSTKEPTDIAEPTYTLRLDYILPFASEEASDLRPLQPLVGVAASPIPNDQSGHQYRVMLTYLNNTILCYEIGRQGSDDFKHVKF